MKENLTEIVFILDRSGSMAGLEDDTIGGFNSMMEKQKKEGGEAIVSTVLFDHISEVLHDRVDLNNVPMMTNEDYFVRGSTALLDAVGGSIDHVKSVRKSMKKSERPAKTLFVITTDGMENASRRYSYDKIRKMIEHEQKKHGWEFIFIGANIDAITEAGKFGIRAERAVNYKCDKKGTETVFSAMGSAVSALRSAAPCCASKALSDCAWAEEINEDYMNRA